MGYTTNIYTYLTEPTGTKELLSANEDWRQVTLRLEGAGPVAVGENQDLQPPQGGKGRLLPTGREVTFTVPPQSRIYISALAVNRVAVTNAPFPWLAQVVAQLAQSAGSAASAIAEAIGKVVNIGAFGFKGQMPKNK